MKVLVATGLYPPEIGGPATYSALIEAGLPSYGIEAVVVPFRHVRTYPKVVRHLVYFWRLLKILWTSDVQIVLALDPVSVGLPALAAAFVSRKTFVVKVVGDYAWEQATQRFGFSGTLEEFQSARVPLIPRVMRMLERMVARAARRVIVPSKYLAGIVTAWDVSPAQLVVIYNGVEVGDVGTKETIRGMLHFDGQLLISVGRLVKWKGFDTLIRVFARLRKKFKKMKLFIVGSGPDLERLEALARVERVEEHVIFAGSVDRDALLRYLRGADVLALNTSYEGFSHLVLESMAVGTPVVTTNIGGNPEAITDGVDGFLVAPNDMTALESRVSKLLNDAVLYARIADAARVRAARFTDARVIEETAALLKTL